LNVVGNENQSCDATLEADVDLRLVALEYDLQNTYIRVDRYGINVRNTSYENDKAQLEQS